MVDFHEPGTPWYCPVPKCENRTYPTWDDLKLHLKKAQAEGDQNHIDIIELEGWDVTSAGTNVKTVSDLEPS